MALVAKMIASVLEKLLPQRDATPLAEDFSRAEDKLRSRPESQHPTMDKPNDLDIRAKVLSEEEKMRIQEESAWSDEIIDVSASIKEITNSTGTFTVDDNGILTGFQSTASNQIKENVWRCLDIPEGIRVIPSEAFHHCEILERLTFPNSLRVISTESVGAFTYSRLPHVELPATLEKLGCYAFAMCTIQSLRIPKGLKSEYIRQFKDSRIGTLYLPEEFREERAYHGFAVKGAWSSEQYGYISSIAQNNQGIEEVIFE